MADLMADLTGWDPDMATRRPYGTGSVSQRKRDGKWIATIDTGWTERGTRRRRSRVASTKSAAQAELRKLMREQEQASAPATRTKPTVKSWAETWLTIQERKQRPNALQATRSQVTHWIIPTIGHKRLDRLNPGDRRAVARAMEQAGLATSSITRCDVVLGKILKDAIIEGHPVPLAVTLASQGATSESSRDAIPLSDALQILAAAAEQPDASRWAAHLLQGMRPAECLGLTWRCVDLKAGQADISWQLQSLPYRVARDRTSGFRVPASYVTKQVHGALHLVRPKTEKGRRIIPLVPWMSSALAAWRDVAPRSPSELVWPRPDGLPNTDAANRAAWFDLCDTAQVAHYDDGSGRRYALYEARHTTATLLRQAGVDDETIKAIMGHATILSTKAYLHTDIKRTRAALEAVAERLSLSPGAGTS